MLIEAKGRKRERERETDRKKTVVEQSGEKKKEMLSRRD
jgi:hypothetical protein